MQIEEKLQNEEIKVAEQSLEDLPVAAEQSEEAKGAGAPNGKLYVATNVGVFVS